MAGGEDYRIKAAEIQALAEREIGESGRADFMRLARGYLLLAELAERNQANDIVYETPADGAAGRASSEGKRKDALDPPPNMDGDPSFDT